MIKEERQILTLKLYKIFGQSNEVWNVFKNRLIHFTQMKNFTYKL